MNEISVIKLHEAYRMADAIRKILHPYCSQIEIAGSIRRARPEVHDIDLVAMPLPGKEDELRKRALGGKVIIANGPKEMIVRMSNGIQVDLYLAHGPSEDLIERTPTNWGSVLLCRTGSANHNIKLAERARALGLAWKTAVGVCEVDDRGNVQKIIASATEEEIFESLQMPWVPPVGRDNPID